MVNKAKSQNVRRAIERADKEARTKAAIKEYRDAQAKSNISRVNQGKRTISEFNTEKQKLTTIEENTLVDLILESAACGFPLDKPEVENLANAVLQTRLPSDSPDATVGVSWYTRFCARHHDRLQTCWSSPLDTQRAKSLNPNAVAQWYERIKKYIVDLGIDPSLIFGMDESGFPRGNTGKARVLASKGTKTQHKQGNADRENVTAIVTICADGTTVKPMIISRPKVRLDELDSIAKSDNGWTDAELGREWSSPCPRWSQFPLQSLFHPICTSQQHNCSWLPTALHACASGP